MDCATTHKSIGLPQSLETHTTSPQSESCPSTCVLLDHPPDSVSTLSRALLHHAPALISSVTTLHTPANLPPFFISPWNADSTSHHPPQHLAADPAHNLHDLYPQQHVDPGGSKFKPPRRCKVGSRLGLRNGQYRPCDTVPTPVSTPQHCPLLHATCPRFPLPPCSPALACVLLPPSLCYRLLATPDRCWIDTSPFVAKLTCLSHPQKSIGPGSSITPLHRPTSKTQDTAALCSMHRASPLAIVPRGLDLILV